MGKMREEFEAWYENEPDRTTATKCAMWKAWQASRAALVVELPANCKGMALTVDELRAMLGEIGVTLK